jgi:flavodoxin
MKTIVIYSTHTARGNTEKIAKAIASELDCVTAKITKDFDPKSLDLNDFELVIIGTGIRGGEPYEDMVNFVENSIFQNSNRQFAIFLTWCGGGASDKLTYDKLRKILQVRNQKPIDNYYKCFGEYLLFRRGHPNVKDANLAKKWVRKIALTVDSEET